MEIAIKGEVKEIAALVVSVQERRGGEAVTPEQLGQVVHAALENCGPVSIGKVDCRLARSVSHCCSGNEACTERNTEKP